MEKHKFLKYNVQSKFGTTLTEEEAKYIDNFYREDTVSIILKISFYRFLNLVIGCFAIIPLFFNFIEGYREIYFFVFFGFFLIYNLIHFIVGLFKWRKASNSKKAENA